MTPAVRSSFRFVFGRRWKFSPLSPPLLYPPCLPDPPVFQRGNRQNDDFKVDLLSAVAGFPNTIFGLPNKRSCAK